MQNEEPNIGSTKIGIHVCNILEFSPGMLAMQKCGFQNFDLRLSA
jgi:hypothetical protein